MDNKELIKVWRKNGFTLRLYDTFKRDSYGKSCLAYQFKDGKEVIFEDDDFYPSHMYAIDSLHAVYSLLGFLSLQLGDTDKEYFDKYTPRQLAWSESSRCEELSILVSDFEERL